MQKLQVEVRDQNQQLLETESKLAVVRQPSSSAPDAERERKNKQRGLEADVTQLQTARAANSEKMKVYEEALNALLQGSAQTGGTQVVQSSFQSVGPATPFNATAGLRENFPRDAGLAPGSPFAGEQSETQAAMQIATQSVCRWALAPEKRELHKNCRSSISRWFRSKFAWWKSLETIRCKFRPSWTTSAARTD